MRISDWSSDVCSSDLGVVPVAGQVVMQAFQPGFAPSVPVVTTLEQDRVVDFDLEPLNSVTVHVVDANGNPLRFASVRIYRDGQSIGRASCRKRVYQSG